ncbi:hypothetical protein MHJ63_02155 [Pseudoglutamicibacter albus]|uniref:DUF4229 domain-containing protein n=2 Tax=Pseudoglutamicibacter albus TaxID=98671 RepID=A0A095ZLH1_9MICC|nr:hypothetical protein [Pseudoglutamicibacter albus]KGF19457.1 hypothetical protein HMPREF2128_10305 [Pseudoglutamicibacter albus DNF00011]MCG7304091.1 hypothetical protein [Pseudoglutamicibacter albus]
MGLIRAVILIGVSMLVYYFFAFNRWPVGGAIASVVVGAVFSFAVTFLFMNKAQAEASQQFRRALNRRKAETKTAGVAPEADAASDEHVEDAYLGAQEEGAQEEDGVRGSDGEKDEGVPESTPRQNKADTTDLADR